MAKFFALVKVQAINFLKLNGKNKKNKAGALSGGLSMVILFIGVFALCGFIYSKMFLEILLMSGSDPKQIIPIMLGLSAVVSFVFSFYTAFSALYGFKDYDLLSSMPIKTTTIVIVKLAFMYIADLFFTICIMVTTVIVCSGYSQILLSEILSLLPLVIFSPLMPITISVILGALVAFVSSKFNKKALIQLILWIILLAGIFALGFFAGMDENPMATITTLYFIYPITLKALNSILHLLLFVLISIIPFALVSILVSITYKKMNALLIKKKTNKNFVLRRGKTLGLSRALFKKEIRKFFSNATYVMNSLIGSVIGAVGLIAFAIISPNIEKQTGINLIETFLPYIPLVFSFCFLMAPSTNCAISIEGQSFWVIRTSPVSMLDVFYAKIKVGIITSVMPAVVSALAVGIIARLEIFSIIILTLVGGMIALFGVLLGLLMNILFPMMKWDNETVAVKQSISVLFTMLGGFLFTGINFLIVHFIPLEPTLLLLIALVLSAVCSFVAFLIIYQKGEKWLIKKIQ